MRRARPNIVINTERCTEMGGSYVRLEADRLGFGCLCEMALQLSLAGCPTYMQQASTLHM